MANSPQVSRGPRPRWALIVNDARSQTTFEEREIAGRVAQFLREGGYRARVVPADEHLRSRREAR